MKMLMVKSCFKCPYNCKPTDHDFYFRGMSKCAHPYFKRDWTERTIEYYKIPFWCPLDDFH